MAALTSQKVRASYEQVLHVDRDGGGNGATVVSVKDGDNGTTFAIVISTTKVAVGPPATLPATPDGTFHAHTASAGTVTASTNADEGVFENSGDCGISLLSPAANQCAVYMGDPDDNDDGGIIYDHADRGLQFRSCGSVAARFGTGGQLFINETTNAKMGGNGITINQGANDDEIFAFKSSDIAHGCTTYAETDTYSFHGKVSGANGGLNIAGFTETQNGVEIDAFVTTANTTKTTAGGSSIPVVVYAINGTGVSNCVDEQNIFSVHCFTGDSVKMRAAIDENGDLHNDGVVTAYDGIDDAVAVRAFDLTRGGKDVIQSQFDDWILANGPDLQTMKIVSPDSLSRKPFTHEEIKGRGFVNVTRLQKLHNGAIWQGRLLDQAIINTVRELMPGRFDEVLEKNMEDLGIGHVKLLH